MENQQLKNSVKGALIGENQFHIRYEDETQKQFHLLMFQKETNSGTELDAIHMLPSLPEESLNMQFYLKKSEIASIKDLLDFEFKMNLLLESDAKKILGQQFILTNEIGEMFNNVIRGRKNAMIWGPPGHGKSEMSEYLFKNAGLTEDRHFFLKSMSIDTSVEEIYGGFDLASLKDRNEQFFNFENSFMNKRIVILEEVLDAPAVVLQALKDILTRKWFANGKQIRPIKTQIIIGLTNHNPEDLASKGDSQKAICERFLYDHKLIWDKYDFGNYNALLRKRYEKSTSLTKERFNVLLKLMLSIIQSNLDEGKKTSPRTAINAFGAILTSAQHESDDFQCISSLKYIKEFSAEMKDMMSSHMASIRERLESKEKLDEFTTKVNELLALWKKIDFRSKKYGFIISNIKSIAEDASNLHKSQGKFQFLDDDYKEYRIQCEILNKLTLDTNSKLTSIEKEWFEHLKTMEIAKLS